MGCAAGFVEMAPLSGRGVREPVEGCHRRCCPRTPTPPPSPPPPPTAPSDDRKVNCKRLPKFYEGVATAKLQDYLTTELKLPTPPDPGAEKQHMLGLIPTDTYRFNMSYRKLKVGSVKLVGCLYEGRKAGALWLDSLDAYHKLAKSVRNKADALGDSVLGSLGGAVGASDGAYQDFKEWHAGWKHGLAAKAAAKAKGTLRERFFPDAIRVEVSDIEFEVQYAYSTYNALGVHLCSGPITVTGHGSLWFDDLSLKEKDLEAMVGGLGRPLSCGGDIKLDDLQVGGICSFVSSQYKDGFARPDLLGMACNGFEAVNHNPFSDGWHWVGPGERPAGLVGKVQEFTKKSCGSVDYDMNRRCMFTDGWEQAFNLLPMLEGLGAANPSFDSEAYAQVGDKAKLCRAEGASCHVWDCCGVNGELKPMWCNPFASGQIGSIGKARCVVCEEGVETGSKEFPGTLVACDATQLNALGKDGGDKVALQAAQIAANLEADRIKSSMAYVPADDARVR